MLLGQLSTLIEVHLLPAACAERSKPPKLGVLLSKSEWVLPQIFK